jgi:hypothetical protein
MLIKVFVLLYYSTLPLFLCEAAERELGCQMKVETDFHLAASLSLTLFGSISSPAV